mgnify:CR=1 FL=1
MALQSTRTARMVGIVALAAIAVACLLVLRPFISALLWAVIIVFSTWPVFAFLRENDRFSPGGAAALMVGAMFLLVGLPIALAAPTSRGEVEALTAQIEALLVGALPALGAWLGGLPVVGGWIRGWLGDAEFDMLGLAGLLRPYAGTITQQTAKNLFLWPGRSWLRKGLEAWIALWMEALLSKARILELYLNLAQFGDNVYGAEAASRHYFGVSAARLDSAQAALLAAVLPNPVRYRVEAPSAHVRSRQQWILGQMRQLGPDPLRAIHHR